MDPNRKITKKFDSKIINRQYFHRKTGLNMYIYSENLPAKKMQTSNFCFDRLEFPEKLEN